jgi:integrase/recombinase XerD
MSSSKQIAALKSSIQKTHIVPYLTPEEVYRIVDVAREGHKGHGNSLLIKTLFETGLRISEALSLTPRMIGEYAGHSVLYIKGKGKKPRMVACPDGLAHQLKSHAYTKKLDLDSRIFDINRKRAWQIINKTAEKTGIQKKVYPHLFRHSDAIERLRQTGNPKALQYHLGHSTTMMTMRYLATLTAEDALRIQQSVNFINK